MQPLMPKATAVWLVENTGLTFDQIGDFCGLHPLEVQAIADGEVAVQMIGIDPVANGQVAMEDIERCQKDPAARLKLTESAHPEAAGQAQGAALHAHRQAPGQARRDRLAGEEPSGTERRADLQAGRHHQADHPGGARPHPLEHVGHQAAPSGGARPVHPAGAGRSGDRAPIAARRPRPASRSWSPSRRRPTTPKTRAAD